MFELNDDDENLENNLVKILVNLSVDKKVFSYGFFWPKIYKNHPNFLINETILFVPNFERIFDQLGDMIAVSLSKKALEDTKLKVGDYLKYERINGNIVFTKI